MIGFFLFPNPPQIPLKTKASGMRHLAFEVDDIQLIRDFLVNQNMNLDEIRAGNIHKKAFFH